MIPAIAIGLSAAIVGLFAWVYKPLFDGSTRPPSVRRPDRGKPC